MSSRPAILSSTEETICYVSILQNMLASMKKVHTAIRLRLKLTVGPMWKSQAVVWNNVGLDIEINSGSNVEVTGSSL